MTRTFEVYTRVEAERYYLIKAETADEAAAILRSDLNSEYPQHVPYAISDYGTEELTGEVISYD